MKKIITLLMVLGAVVLATSCQDDDAILNTTAFESPQPQPEPLPQNQDPQDPAEPQQQSNANDPAGTSWTLVNVSGSIMGVSNDFAPGLITWKFGDNQSVDIINNNTDEFVEDFLDTGNYFYGFTPSEMPTQCSEEIFIWCFVLGCVDINEDTMIIKQVGNDGYTLTFTRS